MFNLNPINSTNHCRRFCCGRGLDGRFSCWRTASERSCIYWWIHDFVHTFPETLPEIKSITSSTESLIEPIFCANFSELPSYSYPFYIIESIQALILICNRALLCVRIYVMNIIYITPSVLVTWILLYFILTIGLESSVHILYNRSNDALQFRYYLFRVNQTVWKTVKTVPLWRNTQCIVNWLVWNFTPTKSNLKTGRKST